MDLKADPEIITRIHDAKDLKDGLQLDLPKLGLLSIPKQTLGLRKLRVLNLRGNLLSMFPTEICDNLTDLEFINLSSNKLQYLPENVSSLTHLRTFLLQNNELSELPSGLGRLPLLTELRLDGNMLATLPDTVPRLASCKVLTLSENRLVELPTALASMKQLESLDLSRNPDLDLDALPDAVYRLNEMYQLLHSKEKRRKVIDRALKIRPAIKAAVQEELFSGGASAGREATGAEAASHRPPEGR